MRKHLVSATIVIVAGLAAGCAADRLLNWQRPSSDDITMPVARREAYREDAARLALRHVLRLGGSAAGQIEIPGELAEDLYQRLVLLDNARDLPARDSVVDLYAIHTFHFPETRNLLVFLTKGTGWADAWKRGDRLTGSPAVDALVIRYGLDVKRCVELTVVPWDMCSLESSRPLNMRALATLFEVVDGVDSSEPNSPVGDGDDLDAGRESDAWRLEYNAGWGDCPAGCTASHRWTFRVRDDGVVEYVGSSGPPPPPPKNRP